MQQTTSTTRQRLLLPWLLAGLLSSSCTNAFVPQIPARSASKTTQVYYNRNSDNDDNNFDLSTLQERIGELRLKILEDDLIRPPNANLPPVEFVQALLDGIFHNEDPRPDAGFMLLLRCSTDQWAERILQSVGAPRDANLDTVASALGTAMGRPHNQYAILVGEEDSDFTVNFPSEALDFLDGTAWVNVEFRNKTDNSLLVLTGWQLCQRPDDGAWLVDQIDWQDYREEYWPGIGREHWMPFEGRKR